MMQKPIFLFPTIYYLKKGCSRVPGFILVLCSVGEQSTTSCDQNPFSKLPTTICRSGKKIHDTRFGRRRLPFIIRICSFQIWIFSWLLPHRTNTNYNKHIEYHSVNSCLIPISSAASGCKLPSQHLVLYFLAKKKVEEK